MSADQEEQDERDPQTHAIIGAAMEVHGELGNGFLEAVYHQALCKELLIRQIPFQRETALQIRYKGKALDCSYRLDFLCFGKIIIEVKATGLERGLLLNFGTPRLQIKRMVKDWNP